MVEQQLFRSQETIVNVNTDNIVTLRLSGWAYAILGAVVVLQFLQTVLLVGMIYVIVGVLIPELRDTAETGRTLILRLIEKQ